jgi:hypothetical protein
MFFISEKATVKNTDLPMRTSSVSGSGPSPVGGGIKTPKIDFDKAVRRLPGSFNGCQPDAPAA